MDDLEKRGIISRTQGSGTRVEQSPAIAYHPETAHTIFQAIALSHRLPRSVVTEFEPIIASDAIAMMTGFPVGTALLKIVRQRFANDLPFAGLETYLLPEALCFERRDLETKSLDAILHDNGWTMDKVEYDIRACSLTNELADFMQVPLEPRCSKRPAEDSTETGCSLPGATPTTPSTTGCSELSTTPPRGVLSALPMLAEVDVQ